MIDTPAGVAQLDNARPPKFSAEMTTSSRASQGLEAGIQVQYASADQWKVTDGDKVTIRNGARAWTILPDRVFIQPGEQVVPPFVLLLWTTHRTKGHHVEALQEVELDDGRPGYRAAVSFHAGSETAQWELSIDQASGLVRHLKGPRAKDGTVEEARLDAVDYSPVFTDHEFEAVIPPGAQIFDEAQGQPGTAKRLLITLVARAAVVWNRFLHPERL